MFSVGEIAIYDPKIRSLLPAECFGSECEIIIPLGIYAPHTMRMYGIEFPDRRQAFVLPTNLRKKKPKGNPNDKDTVIPWDDCIWRPETVNV